MSVWTLLVTFALCLTFAASGPIQPTSSTVRDSRRRSRSRVTAAARGRSGGRSRGNPRTRRGRGKGGHGSTPYPPSTSPGPSACGYSTVTSTAPLVTGRQQVQVGTVSVTVSDSGVSVSYHLDKDGCSLTDTAHVDVTSAVLHIPAPGRFDCHKKPETHATSLEVSCLLGMRSCCDDIYIYAHAVMRCGLHGEEETIFGGPPENTCQSGRWCRYFKISPPCRNGCECEDGICSCRCDTKTCATPCDTSVRCMDDPCIEQIPCATCETHKPYTCPGEDCLTEVQCNSPCDNGMKCSDDCILPTACPFCTTAVPEGCPEGSDGPKCKMPVTCPNCFTSDGDCGCVPNDNDKCNPCTKDVCQVLGGLSKDFNCCRTGSGCKKDAVRDRTGKSPSDREVSLICSTDCSDCDAAMDGEARSCSLFGELSLGNDGNPQSDDLFETCGDTTITTL